MSKYSDLKILIDTYDALQNTMEHVEVPTQVSRYDLELQIEGVEGAIKTEMKLIMRLDI